MRVFVEVAERVLPRPPFCHGRRRRRRLVADELERLGHVVAAPRRHVVVLPRAKRDLDELRFVAPAGCWMVHVERVERPRQRVAIGAEVPELARVARCHSRSNTEKKLGLKGYLQ